jgi:hypothetical protein
MERLLWRSQLCLSICERTSKSSNKTFSTRSLYEWFEQRLETSLSKTRHIRILTQGSKGNSIPTSASDIASNNVGWILIHGRNTRYEFHGDGGQSEERTPLIARQSSPHVTSQFTMVMLSLRYVLIPRQLLVDHIKNLMVCRCTYHRYSVPHYFLKSTRSVTDIY